ncbi:hypothetical protein [Thiothrix subterranea]|uniref:hypothetical protein n=1 Tax=Thiothrix subterranea TaxID=2735563 RepID=UPI00280AED82|nr:hypothetical protein [Thiothrix subterranea]
MLRILLALLLTSFLSACSGTGSTTPTPQVINGTALQAANTVVQAINCLQNGTGGLQPFTDLFDPAGCVFRRTTERKPATRS